MEGKAIVVAVVIAVIIYITIMRRLRVRVRPLTPVSRPPRRTTADFLTLGQLGLPPLWGETDLATALGLTPRELTWLMDRQRRGPYDGLCKHYRVKRIRKAGGGERVLLIPKPRLKAAQRWVLANILAKVPLPDAAHGFRRGRSILTNATPHMGQAVVACCDLRDFFPSITYPRVRGIFRAMGYPPPVAAALALLCTTWMPGSRRRVLPQGAPTSPALSNLAARGLDARLTGLARRLGFTYTRYADDCTFSGTPAGLGALLRTTRCIIRGEGFKFHEKKCRIHRRGSRQQVTGLVVNLTPAVPRTERRRLRAILHQAQRTGLAAQNRDGHPNFEAAVRGKIAYIRMITPRHALSLEAALAQVTATPPADEISLAGLGDASDT